MIDYKDQTSVGLFSSYF